MTSIAVDRLDGLSSSTALKGPCRVVAVANLTLSGLQTIDGVALADGERVLVTGQTDPRENGIYLVDSGTWARAKDFSRNRDVQQGTQVFVSSGTVYSRSGWTVTAANPIVIDTSNITIAQNVLVNTTQLEEFVDDAEESADIALAAAALAAAGAGAPVFATRALAAAYAPAVAPDFIVTAGYTAAGDGGGALYKKVVSEPSHAGKFSISLSGGGGTVWYEIAETTVNVRQLGAQGDGVADDFAEIQAAVNVGRPVEVPPGEYLLSDAVQMVSNLTIRGAGASSKLVSTGTNKRVLYATGKANIAIEGLFIGGNLTGVGSSGATAAGGDGIAFDDCTDVRVANCIFDNIGRSTAGSIASCIRGIEVVGATIEGNLFLENNGGGVTNTGCDIDFSYNCRVLSITGNRSRSEQDSFVYVAAVGSGDETDRIIISGNYAERSDASVTRTGILCPYDAKVSHAVISNNVLINFPANGIYISAGASGTDDTGGVTCTGNIVRFCGGASYMLGISAGIYLSGRNGVTCTGNLVDRTGTDSSGTDRTYDVAGIYMVNSSSKIIVTGNTVRRSTAQGISLSNSGNSMYEVSLDGNGLYDNDLGGISVTMNGAAATLAKLTIVNNTISQETADYDGITIASSSGAPAAVDVTVSGNIVVGIASSTKYGLTTNQSTQDGWLIAGNQFRNWTRGISVSPNLADRLIGTAVVIDGNTFTTCATGIHVGIGAGKMAFHFDSTFVACTAETNDGGRVLAARRQGGGTFEVRKTIAPTDAAWLVGDRVLFSAPVAAGNIGAVCTTAGSPGTWKTYGAIAA